MKIMIIVIAVIIVIAAVVILAVFFLLKGPDLRKYAILREPRLITLANRKVIEVTVKGEPDKVLKGAFSLLIQAYYKIKEAAKGPDQSAPVLRCPLPEEVKDFSATDFGSNAAWKGKVAIAVPETVQSLPALKNPEGLDIRLTHWEYGTVAEILHIGAYEAESPAIRKLQEFIQASGYQITGDHEEEYLRGPGDPFVKPQDYYTIIRYRVIKAK